MPRFILKDGSLFIGTNQFIGINHFCNISDFFSRNSRPKINGARVVRTEMIPKTIEGDKVYPRDGLVVYLSGFNKKHCFSCDGVDGDTLLILETDNGLAASVHYESVSGKRYKFPGQISL